MSLVGGMPVAHLPAPDDFNIVVAEVARNGPEFSARIARLQEAQAECLKVIDIYKKALDDWGTTEEITRLHGEAQKRLDEAEVTLAKARVTYNQIVGDAQVVLNEATAKANGEVAQAVKDREAARTELAKAITQANEVRSNANHDLELARAEADRLLRDAKTTREAAIQYAENAKCDADAAALKLVQVTEKLAKINAIAGA